MNYQARHLTTDWQESIFSLVHPMRGRATFLLMETGKVIPMGIRLGIHGGTMNSRAIPGKQRRGET